MNIILFEEIVFEKNNDGVESYRINNMRIFKLIKGILEEGTNGNLLLLEMDVLIFALQMYPFQEQGKADKIIEMVDNSMRNKIYLDTSKWDSKVYFCEIEKFDKMIKRDYFINGKIKYLSNGWIKKEGLYITPILD